MTNGFDWGSAGDALGRRAGGILTAYEDGKSRMSQELAKQAQAMSQAGLNRAKADEIARRAQYQTPEFGSRIGAALAQFDDAQGEQAGQFTQRGYWGQLPEGIDGPPDTRTPEWATADRMSRFNLGRAAHLANLGATGDTDGSKLVGSFLELMKRNDFEGARANPDTIPEYGAAVAASKGDPLWRQGPNGPMQNFTGAENINEVGRSVAAENLAQSREREAAAVAHRAKADLDRSKIGQPQYVIGPDGMPMAVSAPRKMTAAEQKEVFESDDLAASSESAADMLRQALALNDKALSGWGAKGRAIIRSNLPGESEAANATIDLDNLMTGQALASLKATFGAAPTEGERKILMDIQASADKTPKQRRDILNRAIELAEWRATLNRSKAQALREGTYLAPGYAPTPRAPGAVSAPQSPAAPSKPPALAAVPDAAIAHLQANPQLAGAFAAKYGKAATDAALGKR